MRKKSLYESLSSEALHIIALNEWMANKVRRSPLLSRFPVTVIPNGVNTNTFAPRDPRTAREVLGLPLDAKIVLFAADWITNSRKGFNLLLDAIAGLSSLEGLTLVSVGRGKPVIKANVRHIHLGHFENEPQLSEVYSAADLFVISSIQDNQPNTVLEAMACGTPVVGFHVGGIAEMVRSGVTGMLTTAADVNGLRTGIADLLSDPQRLTTMRTACRRTVLEQYRLDQQSRRYLELYESALQQRSRLSLSVH